MKIFWVWFVVALGYADVFAQQGDVVKWYHIERAQDMAAKEARPIFIDFTAEWCGWCKKMDKTTFSEKEVIKELNDTFYAVKVDFDSKIPFDFKGKSYLAKDLAEEFGIQGLPTMVILSADLTHHRQIVGYQKKKAFLVKLESGTKL